MRSHLFAFLMKINIIFTFHNGNYTDCNENWWWYMLNWEFVWKWLGYKGFAFCEKWYFIFNSVSRCTQAKRIESIESISRSISFCFLFYDIESKEISFAWQQFNFTVDDLYFVPWLARKWTNPKCLMPRGACIKRVIVEKNPKNRSNFLPYYFLIHVPQAYQIKKCVDWTL